MVIPPTGDLAELKPLHQLHPGISRMKGLEQSYVWWPQLEADVESIVNGCDTCQCLCQYLMAVKVPMTNTRRAVRPSKQCLLKL